MKDPVPGGLNSPQHLSNAELDAAIRELNETVRKLRKERQARETSGNRQSATDAEEKTV
jgi:hypothetical protein